MNDDMMAPGPLDEFCKEALKRFKIGSKGLQVVFQKGAHGPEFKFRPVYYNFQKDYIVLHHDLINELVKVHKVPAEPLMRYLMFFGVGMAAEARRRPSSVERGDAMVVPGSMPTPGPPKWEAPLC